MARPKKGAKGHELATAKWRKTMQEKYGGQEGVHQMMQEIGAKGGRNGRGPGYNGGFASTHVGKDGLTGRERSVIAGQKGGKIGGRISKRGPKKNAEGVSRDESA